MYPPYTSSTAYFRLFLANFCPKNREIWLWVWVNFEVFGTVQNSTLFSPQYIKMVESATLTKAMNEVFGGSL